MSKALYQVMDSYVSSPQTSVIGKGHDPKCIGLIVLYLCLTVIVTSCHYKMVDLPYNDRQILWHKQIVSGDGPYPDQYRILTYLLAEGLQQMGLSFSLSHLLLRGLFVFFSILLFHLYLRKWFDTKTTMIGCLFVIAVMPLTYLGYFMQPTDPLNFLIFIAGYMLILERKDRWLFPLLVVGMLNRETATMLIVIYALNRFGEVPWKEWVLNAVGLLIVSLSIYFGLRWLYGYRPPYASTSPLYYWASNLRSIWTYVRMGVLLNVFWIYACIDLKSKPRFLVRSAMTIPFFVLVYFSAGYAREVRYWLPLFPIVIPLGLFSLFGQAQESALQETT